MKMVFIMETQKRVLEEQLKSTAGGDGFSGIVATAFATVTIKIQVPIDILASDLWCLTSRTTSKNSQ